MKGRKQTRLAMQSHGSPEKLPDCCAERQILNTAQEFSKLQNTEPKALEGQTPTLGHDDLPQIAAEVSNQLQCQAVVTCARSPCMETKATRKEKGKAFPGAITGIMDFIHPAAYLERPVIHGL